MRKEVIEKFIKKFYYKLSLHQKINFKEEKAIIEKDFEDFDFLKTLHLKKLLYKYYKK